MNLVVGPVRFALFHNVKCCGFDKLVACGLASSLPASLTWLCCRRTLVCNNRSTCRAVRRSVRGFWQLRRRKKSRSRKRKNYFENKSCWFCHLVEGTFVRLCLKFKFRTSVRCRLLIQCRRVRSAAFFQATCGPISPLSCCLEFIEATCASMRSLNLWSSCLNLAILLCQIQCSLFC